MESRSKHLMGGINQIPDAQELTQDRFGKDSMIALRTVSSERKGK
jgi:hypothetical protein